MDPKEAKFEQERIDHDLTLKTRELDLKRRELDLKERELTGKNTRWLTPQQATILVAVIGIVAAAIGSIVQGILSQHLERDRFRTSLILKAVETGDRKQASDNLLRLFEWHLIDDPDGQIVNAIKHEPADVPVLPRPDSSSPVETIKPTVLVPQANSSKSNVDTKIMTYRVLSSNLSVEAGVGPENSRRVSTTITAPGPIEKIDLSLEGVGGPWLHTDKIEKLNDKESKWIGFTTSSAPVILVFTVTYRI